MQQLGYCLECWFILKTLRLRLVFWDREPRFSKAPKKHFQRFEECFFDKDIWFLFKSKVKPNTKLGFHMSFEVIIINSYFIFSHFE